MLVVGYETIGPIGNRAICEFVVIKIGFDEIPQIVSMYWQYVGVAFKRTEYHTSNVISHLLPDDFSVFKDDLSANQQRIQPPA